MHDACCSNHDAPAPPASCSTKRLPATGKTFTKKKRPSEHIHDRDARRSYQDAAFPWTRGFHVLRQQRKDRHRRNNFAQGDKRTHARCRPFLPGRCFSLDPFSAFCVPNERLSAIASSRSPSNLSCFSSSFLASAPAPGAAVEMMEKSLPSITALWKKKKKRKIMLVFQA